VITADIVLSQSIGGFRYSHASRFRRVKRLKDPLRRSQLCRGRVPREDGNSHVQSFVRKSIGTHSTFKHLLSSGGNVRNQCRPEP
jgi:hypothetical protein